MPHFARPSVAPPFRRSGTTRWFWSVALVVALASPATAAVAGVDPSLGPMTFERQHVFRGNAVVASFVVTHPAGTTVSCDIDDWGDGTATVDFTPASTSSDGAESQSACTASHLYTTSPTSSMYWFAAGHDGTRPGGDYLVTGDAEVDGGDVDPSGGGTVVEARATLCHNDRPEPGEEIVGTLRPDTLCGTNEDNVIRGLRSRDVLHGLGGDDSLYGGLSSDVLDGDGGDDRLVGGPAKDKMSGGGGRDVLIGGADDDFLHADWSAEQGVPAVAACRTCGLLSEAPAYGGQAGPGDVLRGERGQDLLVGGDGDDVLSGGDHGDRLVAGLGFDTIWGDAGSDKIRSCESSALDEYVDDVFGGPGDDLGRTDEADHVDSVETLSRCND